MDEVMSLCELFNIICKKRWAWFENEFIVMDWPGNSPDHNPIETCWSYMKRRLKGYSTITSSTKQVEAIKNMWIKEMDGQYFKNLANSIPKRIQWIIEHNGDMMKY